MITIKVKVVPGSKHQKWQLMTDNTIKCYLQAPPEKGKANKELIALLSRVLKINTIDIVIIQGELDRNKVIGIRKALSFKDILSALGLQKQMNLF